MNNHAICKLKRDKYVSSRDGNSHLLELYCSKCGQYLVLYQKDGLGALLRLYVDRIFEPKEIAQLQTKNMTKDDLPKLRCKNCDSLVGLPMIYEPEQRLAFRLIRGSFVKKNIK